MAGVVGEERNLVPEHGQAEGRCHVVHRAGSVQVEDDRHCEKRQVARELPGIVDVVGLKQLLLLQTGLELAVGLGVDGLLGSKDLLLGARGRVAEDGRKLWVGIPGEIVGNLKVLDFLFEHIVWVERLDLVRTVTTDAVANSELSTGVMLDPLVELVDLLVDDDEDLTGFASRLELRL